MTESAVKLTISERLSDYQTRLENPIPLVVEGKLVRMVGLTLEAVGVEAAIGTRCNISTQNGEYEKAEVVGFSGDSIYLMPAGEIYNISPGAKVIPTNQTASVQISDALLGRVIDGEGEPLDGKGPITDGVQTSIIGRPINPLQRHPISEPLDVGVRSINSILTVGRGQRMGLFAGSGVGKSVLLGMMTRFTAADVIVVGLIGERGREVKEFIENILGVEGMSRAVVVAVPADQSPLMRLNGALVATSIAEYFRDKGKNVLLLMDSLTRFCQAQRELALAIGEPPATKGYPPSVFTKLPKLVERAGNADKGEGSITAFYTVLTEGDDNQDPIADAARAILDGHIVLSRQIAETGHYPAIDIEQSISRVMPQITDEGQQMSITAFKRIYATYQHNKDLISVGAYQQGADPYIDESIEMLPAMQAFLSQGMNEKVNFNDSVQQLGTLMTQTD
ncbi:MAG: flagellar protein export ATPase FliI [Gammaproteobacteria bacterium]|nr:MAG: flagellar protein export ATPase FliI [Gammaproteobacteria bacterium]